jgi:hypothetical protein
VKSTTSIFDTQSNLKANEHYEMKTCVIEYLQAKVPIKYTLMTTNSILQLHNDSQADNHFPANYSSDYIFFNSIQFMPTGKGFSRESSISLTIAEILLQHLKHKPETNTMH